LGIMKIHWFQKDWTNQTKPEKPDRPDKPDRPKKLKRPNRRIHAFTYRRSQRWKLNFEGLTPEPFSWSWIIYSLFHPILISYK
jgi:hypothetical protein